MWATATATARLDRTPAPSARAPAASRRLPRTRGPAAMAKRTEFLSLRVHPNIAAAALVALFVGLGKFYDESKAAQAAGVDQQRQIAELSRRLVILEGACETHRAVRGTP